LHRDPHLHPPHRRQLATIDIFVDDFIGAGAQGPTARLNRVCRILLNAVLDQVFRPVDPGDSIFRYKPSRDKKKFKDAS
jgi:hypothetical protein